MFHNDTNKILKAFHDRRSFLISTHINPDPDALASELAVAAYLRSLKKKVVIINEKVVSKRYLFMPGAAAIRKMPLKLREDFDAVIIVDCGDRNRIGTVEPAISDKHTLINIDHHLTNHCFGHLNYVDPQASSTSELIFTLLKHAHFPLDKKVAILLYLGIMTDTGSFRYENTTAYTHQVVAELMRFDFSVSALYRHLYETIPLTDIVSFSKVVNNIRPLFQGRVICVELPRTVLRKFSEAFDLRDKIFQYLRAIKDVEVVIILTEEGPYRTRVNLRSHGKVNVAKLAYQWSGGGHSRASGCLINHSIPQARRLILRDVRRALAQP